MSGAVVLEDKKEYQLCDKEIKLIEYCRALGYGQLVIFIENKIPIRIEEMKKSIKL